jgi:hypothetical protein
MIVKLMNSDKPNKRYKVLTKDNKTFDFGLKNGNTYIDHFDDVKRDNYIKRHYALKKERPFIDNLIPSASLYSLYLLWGPYTDINKNIEHLNNLLKKKTNI